MDVIKCFKRLPIKSPVVLEVLIEPVITNIFFHYENYVIYYSCDLYRWWSRRNCQDFSKPSAGETSELQIENVAGVFFILVSGIGFAGLVCGVEYFMKMLHKAAKLVCVCCNVIF